MSFLWPVTSLIFANTCSSTPVQILADQTALDAQRQSRIVLEIVLLLVGCNKDLMAKVGQKWRVKLASRQNGSGRMQMLEIWKQTQRQQTHAVVEPRHVYG